ncbi:MAG: hypothetical protein WEC33_09780, partial [Dehalococcoidia bacterium]
MTAALDLGPEHQAMIDASAITSEVSQARGYFTATTKREIRDLGFPPSQQLPPTLVIPIHDVKGDLSTYQLR